MWVLGIETWTSPSYGTEHCRPGLILTLVLFSPITCPGLQFRDYHCAEGASPFPGAWVPWWCQVLLWLGSPVLLMAWCLLPSAGKAGRGRRNKVPEFFQKGDRGIETWSLEAPVTHSEAGLVLKPFCSEWLV